MKIKNLILLPALSMVLASCASVNNVDSFSSISKIDDPISASSIDENHSDTNPISSELPESTFQFSVSGVNQLRSPEGLFDKPVNSEQWNSDSYKSFRDKMRAFSSKLSEIMVNREFSANGNFAFSPLSIELCLGLAIRSADGETRRELLSALDMDYETFNTNYKIFFDLLYQNQKSYYGELMAQLLLTNSIWIDNDVKLKDSGLDALRDDYYCYSYDVDFNGHNAEANQAIKEFINYNTKGLLNPDLRLSPSTMFVLMNTLYIKDIWNEDGHDLLYAPDTYQFTNSDGTKSSKKLLAGYANSGKTLVTDDFTSFFTSTGNLYHIYFIKPNEGKNLKDVFTKEAIDYVLNHKNYIYRDEEKLERYYTQCYFPEYDVSCDIDLSKAFKEDLDVNTLFGTNCNFSNLTDEIVFCNEFKQIAKLEVNKKGIEGAAVTYMAYAGAAGPDEWTDVYEQFVVDKEFGFVLTSNESVIFSGIVNNIDK